MDNIKEAVVQVGNFLLANDISCGNVLFLPIGSTKWDDTFIDEINQFFQSELSHTHTTNKINASILQNGINTREAQKNIRLFKNVVLIVQEYVVKNTELKNTIEIISNLNGNILGAIYVSRK